MINTILVPVDGSGHADKALEVACDLARKYDAALHLLHVTQSPSEGYAVVLEAAALTIEALQEAAEQEGTKVIDAARRTAARHGCSEVESQVLDGPPAQRILDYAREHQVDMIVLGSRGLSDIAGLLLGSVSHKVSHLSECSCVVVR